MNATPRGPHRWPRHKVWMVGVVAAGMLAAPPLLRLWRGVPAGMLLNIHASPRALPNLVFSDSRGQPTSLAAFRGRTVLLNIWATWCTPCREEMPTLDRLQAKLGGPAFEVVALSIDKAGLPAVQAFYKSIGIQHLAQYLDSSGEATANLVATGIPLTLLVDGEGREIGRKLGPATWDDAAMVEMIRGHAPGTVPAAAAPR